MTEYLNAVKDAPKEREQFAIEALNHFSLFKLKGRVEEAPTSDGMRQSGNSVSKIDRSISTSMRWSSCKAKVTSEGGMKKMIHILLWEFIKEKATGIMARMERLKPLNALMQIALELDHLSRPLSDTNGEIAHTLSKLSQAIMNDTSFVRKSIPALEMGVYAIQQDQDHHRHDKILEWISPTDFPTQQYDFIARR